METKRQKQVAEVVKRNFSLVLQLEAANYIGHKILISVTQVKMSPDLVNASVYLSVFGTERKQAPIDLLTEEMLTLRGKLAQRIKKQVRIIPYLNLFLDDTLDEMFRINNLMQRLEDEGQLGKKEDGEKEA